MDNLNKLNSIYKSIHSQLEFANSINSPEFIDAITRNYNFMNEIQSNIDTFKAPNYILSYYNFIDKFKNPFENLTTASDVIEKYNSIITPLTEYLNSINFDLYSNEILSDEETEIVHKVIDDISQDEDFSLDKDLKYIENIISSSIENAIKSLDNPKSVNKSSIFPRIILEIITALLAFFNASGLINVGDIDYNKTNNTYNIENIENVNIINNEYNHKED